MNAKPPTLPGAGPNANRNSSIDTLRGFALLGILIMNIQGFGLISAAYSNPHAGGGGGGLDDVAYTLTKIIGDLKFMAIFSLLFGAGVILITQRIDAAGGSPAGMWYRRCGWLLVFGIIHAAFFWVGDILVCYALCGMAVYPLRKINEWAQLLIGGAVFCVPQVLFVGIGAMLLTIDIPEATTDIDAEWNPTTETIEAEIAAYHSDFIGQIPQRLGDSALLWVAVIPLYLFWRASGLMLIGMALFRLGFLANKLPPKTYLKNLGLIPVGWLIIWLEAHLILTNSDNAIFCSFFYPMINYFASILVVLGYISGIFLLCRLAAAEWITTPLAAVGRTAFSNYILQSILAGLIFYGHGLGQFEQLGRAGALATVPAIWLIQVILTLIWLCFFRIGPLEWCWRRLTYWKPVPMRRSIPKE